MDDPYLDVEEIETIDNEDGTHDMIVTFRSGRVTRFRNVRALEYNVDYPVDSNVVDITRFKILHPTKAEPKPHDLFEWCRLVMEDPTNE